MRSIDEDPERSGNRRDATAAERRERQISHIHRDLIVPRLNPHRFRAADDMNAAAENLINAGKLLNVAASIEPHDRDAASRLGAEAASMAIRAAEPVSDHLVDNGVAAVIEDHASTIAEALDVSDLPAADLEAMRRCGSTDPVTELELSVERLRKEAADRARRKTAETEIARLQNVAIEIAAAREIPWEHAVYLAMEALSGSPPESPGRPRRRWFKGIGTIVKGLVLVTVDGGLLVAGTSLGVANASATVGVLGSLAMGFNDVTAGVGDLRGE